MRAIGILLLYIVVALGAQAQTSIWEVSSGDDRILIGGTAHLLRASDFPLPPEFEHAYQASDRIYFETDLAAAGQATFARQLRAQMQLPRGVVLRDVLTTPVYARLARFAASRGIELASLASLQPAMVTLLLTMTEYERYGFGAGVEGFFLRRTVADKKPTGFLETPAEQLTALGALTRIDPDRLIAYTLDDLAQLESFTDDMVKHWRAGSLYALDDLYIEEMRAGFPAVYQTLVDDRNRNWLPKLQAMFGNETAEFVLVGALHLTGSNNVLQLLGEAGFTISRYRPEAE